ncbi:MAG: hypothetical protein KAI66_27795 [Lentisphaeria bacterium]|nr:hypothetical protein [Lentisphaeria bacterium]
MLDPRGGLLRESRLTKCDGAPDIPALHVMEFRSRKAAEAAAGQPLVWDGPTPVTKASMEEHADFSIAEWMGLGSLEGGE